MSPSPAGAGHEPTQALRLTVESLAGGRYELGRQLGAGGMGIVRLAHDRLLDREVAVKLLADNLAADEEARARFVREARAAARINHPNVVAVHDVGEDSGRPYLVMELIDGPSLDEVLRRDGPLGGHRVLTIAEQVLAGLAEAHGNGLLHRDVKPSNLLSGDDRSVKLTDLGVVAAEDESRLTRTGFVVGTASYLAPERRRGEPATVRTDLYALGATLVELLVGRPPRGDARPEFDPGLPPGLLQLLPRLLADAPEDRPEDAAAAVAILRGEAATEAVRRQGRRSPPYRSLLTVGALAVAGVVVVATGVLVSISDGDPDQVVDTGAPVPPPADGGTEGGGVELVQGDPAATAENLARWLRELPPTDPG